MKYMLIKKIMSPLQSGNWTQDEYLLFEAYDRKAVLDWMNENILACELVSANTTYKIKEYEW